MKDDGFEVIETETADEAPDDDEAVHFLFTGIWMPDMATGVNFANEVAARFCKAGIIVASSRITPIKSRLRPRSNSSYDPIFIVSRSEALSGRWMPRMAAEAADNRNVGSTQITRLERIEGG